MGSPVPSALCSAGKLPLIALEIGFANVGRIGNLLAKEFLGYIRASGQHEAADVLPRHFFHARIPEAEIAVGENFVEVLVAVLLDPSGDMFHASINSGSNIFLNGGRR